LTIAQAVSPLSSSLALALLLFFFDLFTSIYIANINLYPNTLIIRFKYMMPTPTETWQDRRGMFQRGKEVHQPGRKLSNQFGDPLAARRTSTGSTGGGGLEKTDSIPEPGSLGQRRRVSLVVVQMLPV